MTNPQNGQKQMFIYFSQLIGRSVLDKDAESAGELYDIVVQPTEIYPQSSQLIIRRGFPNRQYAVIKWSDIQEMDSKEIRLSIDKSGIIFQEKHDNKGEMTLRRDILDQQVVDVYNHKVIRVNDIHLLFVDHAIMLAHVDISTRGLIRRLGLEKLVDFLVRLLKRNAEYLKEGHLVSWKHIQPLSINPVSMTIKIDVARKQMKNIPSADLGEIFLDLNIKDQIALFAYSYENLFKTAVVVSYRLKSRDVKRFLRGLAPFFDVFERGGIIPVDERGNGFCFFYQILVIESSLEIIPGGAKLYLKRVGMRPCNVLGKESHY